MGSVAIPVVSWVTSNGTVRREPRQEAATQLKRLRTNSKRRRSAATIVGDGGTYGYDLPKQTCHVLQIVPRQFREDWWRDTESKVFWCTQGAPERWCGRI